ncbi:hypothetical protein SeMB42_g06300 [Synchytrium endobioticum]|uniref:Lysophospholipase NTE1 n=1 Tax=Synchytrium endobioticum TaxID=286115 RepID=A0A507CM65_9FUNG|nr:hypothetical protein SeMB42_g06300 [Synchytrium endobioticum]
MAEHVNIEHLLPTDVPAPAAQNGHHELVSSGSTFLASMWYLLRGLLTGLYHLVIWTITLPLSFYSVSVTTVTIVIDHQTFVICLVLGAVVVYLLFRYIILTRYSRLHPIPKTKPIVPFDLHPDATLEDTKDEPKGYPDEFLGAFLSSIKVFGYLDRPVFHELAQGLQTRKVRERDVLFKGDEDDGRDFYVVVDGSVQIFIKGQGNDERDQARDHVYEVDDGDNDGMEGYHLLNEVHTGQTVSSLFNILAVLADDRIPSTPFPTDTPNDAEDTSIDVLSGEKRNSSDKEPVFPKLSTSEATGSPPYTPSESQLDELAAQTPAPAIHNSSARSSLGLPPLSNGSYSSRSSFIRPSGFHQYRAISRDIVARAAVDTTLVVIPAASFSRLAEKFPKAAAHIAQVILTRFQRVTFLTLYRYLGLTRELLHIERTVNEFQGYINGLPPDFPHAAMDRLRLRQAMKADANTSAESESQPPSRKASISSNHAHRPSVPSSTKPSPVTQQQRVTRFADSAIAYDADAESKTTRPTILHTPKMSIKSNIPGLLGDGGVRLGTEVDASDTLDLKKAVFECIADLIGLKYDRYSTSAPPSAVSTASNSKQTRNTTFFVGGSGEAAMSHHPNHREHSLPNIIPHLRFQHRSDSVSSSKDGQDSDTESVSSTTSSAISASKASNSWASHWQPDPYNDVKILGFERGTVIVKAGEKVPGLYFVADGVVEASMIVDPPLESSGRLNDCPPPSVTRRTKKSLFLIRPGGVAGYISALTGHGSFVTLRAKTDCHLGFIPKSVLDRYVDRNSDILLTLAKRLLAQLSPAVLYIDLALEWSVVNAGQKVCRQDEKADSIFIVLSGRLRAIAERQRPLSSSTSTLTSSAALSPNTSESDLKSQLSPPVSDPNQPANEFEILGEYGQSESVGEFEVLTGSRRPATMHAIRDTEIAVMPKTLFNALAMRHPEITVQISRIIAERSLALAKQARDPIPMYMTGTDFAKNSNLKTVAILPVSGGVPIMDFADKLRDALDLVGASVALLNTSSVMAALGRHAFSRMGRLKTISWLADQEEHHRLILYVADGGVNAPWTQRCVRQADCILLIGLGDEDPSIGEYERLLMGMKTTARKELVLLHSERHCAPGSTAQWLKNRLWVHAHHHVQMQLFPNPKILSHDSRKNTLANIRSTFQRYYTRASGVHLHRQGSDPRLFSGLRSDFARLARRLLSKSIGIAFGGGGARGMAHIGILRAFEEAGIPVDMVGGTSIGSFVGGLYARENDHVSIYGRAKNFAGRTSSVWRQLLDLTYPVTALFTGHEFNRGIWKCFSDTHIEDCWLSFFAVTANITWSRMEVHRVGYMWRYIRASMSLAGFLPPICDNGDMLIDGGYLNNVPADIIRSLGANVIVAIDVGGSFDTLAATYGDSLSGWWALVAPYIPFIKPGKIPAQAEIQSRLTYVASVKQLHDVKNSPDVLYMHPPVVGYGVLQFEKFQQIYEAGYEYGKEIVKKWEEDGTLEERFGVRPDAASMKRGRTRRNKQGTVFGQRYEKKLLCKANLRHAAAASGARRCIALAGGRSVIASVALRWSSQNGHACGLVSAKATQQKPPPDAMDDELDALASTLLSSASSHLARHTVNLLGHGPAPVRAGEMPSRSQKELDARNPAMLDLFLCDTGIAHDMVLIPFVPDVSKHELKNVDYMALRAAQNRQWAQETVRIGTGFARDHNDAANAVKAYARALHIDPQCVDAYIARGTLLANQGALDRAIPDFEAALKMHPDDPTAKRGLQAARHRLGELHREKADVLSGDFLMPVSYQPNNKFTLASVNAASAVPPPVPTPTTPSSHSADRPVPNDTKSEASSSAKKKKKKKKQRSSSFSSSEDSDRYDRHAERKRKSSKSSSKSKKEKKSKHRHNKNHTRHDGD